MLFLTILRPIQAGIVESSVRGRQNRIDNNVFSYVNFAKTLVASFRRGRSTTMSFTHNRNALFPEKGQMIERIAQF